MHSVIETPMYLAAAKHAGMSDVEREAVVTIVARDPQAGDIIAGSGGARKLRIAREGKGKSGGYRLITYFSSSDNPVLLVTVISKGQTANLSERQKQAVKETAKAENRLRRLM